jgi:hypothetical protein
LLLPAFVPPLESVAWQFFAPPHSSSSSSSSSGEEEEEGDTAHSNQRQQKGSQEAGRAAAAAAADKNKKGQRGVPLVTRSTRIPLNFCRRPAPPITPGSDDDEEEDSNTVGSDGTALSALMPEGGFGQTTRKKKSTSKHMKSEVGWMVAGQQQHLSGSAAAAMMSKRSSSMVTSTNAVGPLNADLIPDASESVLRPPQKVFCLEDRDIFGIYRPVVFDSLFVFFDVRIFLCQHVLFTRLLLSENMYTHHATPHHTESRFATSIRSTSSTGRGCLTLCQNSKKR